MIFAMKQMQCLGTLATHRNVWISFHKISVKYKWHLQTFYVIIWRKAKPFIKRCNCNHITNLNSPRVWLPDTKMLRRTTTVNIQLVAIASNLWSDSLFTHLWMCSFLCLSSPLFVSFSGEAIVHCFKLSFHNLLSHPVFLTMAVMWEHLQSAD